MSAVVVIPALSPDKRLCEVIRGCLDMGLCRIVVVDDGSSDEYRPFFDEAQSLGARVLRHEHNKGKGAAIKTGIEGALSVFSDLSGIVTADADGQHAPEDILRVCKALCDNPDAVILGSRELTSAHTPLRSRVGNGISAGFFFLMTGVRCRDTQTGLRGISRGYLDLALRTPGSRYDYEMNFLMDIARKKRPILMIPISTIYLDGNSSSHFRAVYDSAIIFQRPLKYIAVALGSYAVDIGIFSALTALAFARDAAGVWSATVIARCVSGLFNFKLNQLWSFRVRKRSKSQFFKYLLLFVSVMAASSALVTLLSPLPAPLPLIKAAVDLLLFFFNYWVLNNWVF